VHVWSSERHAIFTILLNGMRKITPPWFDNYAIAEIVKMKKGGVSWVG